MNFWNLEQDVFHTVWCLATALGFTRDSVPEDVLYRWIETRRRQTESVIN